jgi:ankyrin repeat protein
LHGAVFGGHLNVVQYLVEHRASLELQNGIGCSPIWLASGYNHLQVLNYLLLDNTVVEIILQANKTGDSPLLEAASKRKFQICQRLAELYLLQNQQNNSSSDSDIIDTSLLLCSKNKEFGYTLFGVHFCHYR